MEMKGIPASPGIGIGRAVRVIPTRLDYSHVVSSGPEGEKARLAQAEARFSLKLRALADSARKKAGAHQAEILEGQLILLADPFLQSQLEAKIEGGVPAEEAVDTVFQTFIDLFAASDDPLTAQRSSDIEDMRRRLLSLLLGREEPDLGSLPPDTVLVVDDLTPTMATALDSRCVVGIVTQTGGMTSHSAILARAMGLPAVLGVPQALDSIGDGDTVIVDGSQGLAVVRPHKECLNSYEKALELQSAERAQLETFRTKSTLTADGQRFALYGNIGTPAEAQTVRDAGGEGVGLFRTEFLFMERATPPSEEEQFQAYRTVAQVMGGREVVIRTLDVGGDKDVPYLHLNREENPFLGFRAIRYCLAHEELFSRQLRAILRASAFGRVKIMLPLVTSLSEIRRTRVLLEKLKQELSREGVAFDKDISLGVMIETPAAVLMADALAREAEFFSIGTNDLTQYVMAADRGNPEVAQLGTPLDPAVLRAIRHVISAAKTAHIPVSMCGEAAADKRLIPLFLSFGLEKFSVNPAAILPTRREIARWTLPAAEKLTAQAMEEMTAQEVEERLKNALS